MGIITYLNPNVINDNSISSSKIDGTVASKSYVDTQVNDIPVEKGTGYNSLIPSNDDTNNAYGKSSTIFGHGNTVGNIDKIITDPDDPQRGDDDAGYGALATGLSSIAKGRASHCEGEGCKANGAQSHAEGNHTTASGKVSHAEGSYTTASGEHSHAEGNLCKASGNRSHAEGDQTIAEGTNSHTEGYSTQSTGISSHSEGYESIAGGNVSHSEGYNTKATGHHAHSEGDNTNASGSCSHSEGNSTVAAGFISHAEGKGTIAKNDAEHAEGIYNKSNTNTIHSVGIGTSKTDRKNAHEIHLDGKHYIYGIGGYDGTNSQTEGIKTVQEVVGEVENAVQITYAELKSLRGTGKLVPGTQYRITDYTCTTTQAGTKSAGHVFDIIVTADDESTLNEEARAILHTGDTYFANSNLSAWKIWYCLDNDSDRFAWAAFGELIGTIKPATGSASGTYTYNSPISKIMFADRIYTLKIGVRTLINPGPPTYITKTDDYTLVVEDEYGFVNGHLGISVYTVSQEDKGVIYRMIDEFNNDVPYDFKNIQFKHPNDTTTYPYYYYTFASANVEANTDNSLSISNKCYANNIAEYLLDGKKTLNCIIFIGGNCYNNTFSSNCYNNIFGSSCSSNKLGTYATNNIFGNNCDDNILGDGCHNNTFGTNCISNIFGNNCYNNAFGDDCFGNTYGNYCSHILLGNNNYSNSFGNYCYKIMFTDSSASKKYSHYNRNHFGDGCQYIVFTGAETASKAQQVQNYNFAKGLQSTSSAYLTIDGVRNRAYETKVARNSNGELKIYCEADLIL